MLMPPKELVRLSIQTSLMLAEAQMVIAMRMMGMMGLWRVMPSENTRMSSEKVTALGEAAMAASRAVMAGKLPVRVVEAALKPIRSKTSANVKRLVRRGPGQS